MKVMVSGCFTDYLQGLQACQEKNAEAGLSGQNRTDRI
jgi:hypothetical protein